MAATLLPYCPCAFALSSYPVKGGPCAKMELRSMPVSSPDPSLIVTCDNPLSLGGVAATGEGELSGDTEKPDAFGEYLPSVLLLVERDLSRIGGIKEFGEDR